ncbi:MAG: hypothetical protein ACXVXP_09705 [Mycobacteriaceae bacterium]
MPNDRPGELERRVRDLERLVQEMAAARTLENATINSAAGLGIRTSDFDGTSFANPGTVGNYWGGDGQVISKVLFRPNAISNDWLANPSTPQAVYDSVQNFSLSTTLTNIRTTPVTIPAGFTKAAVQLTVRAYATNPNTTGGNNGAGGDYLYAQANINGFNGYALPTGVSGSGGSGTNVSTFAVVLTGLTPGGTVSLQCAVQTGFLSWAANANNTVDLSASIGWYR